MAAPHRIRVIAADDHPMYRQSMVRAFKHHPDIELVGEAGDGRRALELVRELSPDVAVVDIGMPVADGAQVAQATQRDHPGTRVLVITGDVHSPRVFDAVEAGAAGVLSKTVMPDELVDAVLAVARGEVRIDADAQQTIVMGIRRRAADDGPALTPREREVLSHVADGRSVPDMARTLFLSQSTIKTHLDHIYRKLGVSDRAAAVAEALRRGILD